MKYFLTVILFSYCAIAQVTFERAFGGINEDVGYSVRQTNDGGYIVSGWTRSFGSDNANDYLIKLDQNGNESWSNFIGGAGEDVSLDI